MTGRKGAVVDVEGPHEIGVDNAAALHVRVGGRGPGQIQGVERGGIAGDPVDPVWMHQGELVTPERLNAPCMQASIHACTLTCPMRVRSATRRAGRQTGSHQRRGHVVCELVPGQGVAQGPLLRRRRAPQEGLGARVIAVLAQGMVPEGEGEREGVQGKVSEREAGSEGGRGTVLAPGMKPALLPSQQASQGPRKAPVGGTPACSPT